MAETPRLDLPYLAASQAQKEIMHNIGLDRLDILAQCAVLDRNLATPPASPALGDAYIVAAAPTGAWAGQANALALWVSSQWQLIAPLPGFLCWVLDEAVLVYWSGSAWTIVTSGGGGATTLLGLTDTPDSYSGQAGKTLLVNPGETALVFGTTAGSAPVDATYIVSGSNTTLTAERVVTDNAQITWDVSTAGQLKATLAAHGVTLDKLPQLPEGSLLGRGGTLAPLDDVQALTVGGGLEIAGTMLQVVGGGVGTFLALSDTPDAYAGQAGKSVIVNAGATGLDFGVPPAGVTTFLALSDTPDTYSGQANKSLVVNSAATGLDFTMAATGSYDLGITWSGTLPASQVLLRFPFPRGVDFPAGLTGSRGVAAVAATALTTLDLRKNGVSVGSVQYAAGATTATFTMASATSFAAGDVLTVHAPASADATLADLGLSLAGTRAVAAGEMGATTFLGLTDTPDVYASNALKILRVNAGATATEFGPVLGTMSTQDANAVAITGGTATGLTSLVTAAGLTAQFLGSVGIQAPPTPAAAVHLLFRKDVQDGLRLQATITDTAGGGNLSFLNVAGTLVGRIHTDASTTTYATTSDGRVKEAVQPLADALAVVQALRPVQFRWKATGAVGHGLLAEEVQPLVPEAVVGQVDDGLPLGLDASKLVPYLIGAVQALSQQVEVLTARLAAAGA